MSSRARAIRLRCRRRSTRSAPMRAATARGLRHRALPVTERPCVGWASGAKHLVVLIADDVPHDDDLNAGVPPEIVTSPRPGHGDGRGPTGTGIDWQRSCDFAAADYTLAFVLYHGFRRTCPTGTGGRGSREDRRRSRRARRRSATCSSDHHRDDVDLPLGRRGRPAAVRRGRGSCLLSRATRAPRHSRSRRQLGSGCANDGTVLVVSAAPVHRGSAGRHPACTRDRPTRRRLSETRGSASTRRGRRRWSPV